MVQNNRLVQEVPQHRSEEVSEGLEMRYHSNICRFAAHVGTCYDEKF